MSDPTQPVLTLRNVTYKSSARVDEGILDASLEVRPGDRILVLLATHTRRTSLLDLAHGLLVPDSGQIDIMGADWAAMDTYESARQRWLIGRIFDGNAWISNLTLRENIALAELHHSRRSAESIDIEIDELADHVDIHESLSKRPAVVHARDLQRAQWVRAFLGNPELVLMDHPELGVSEDRISRLVQMVDTACVAGAAVIWVTSDRRMLRCAGTEMFLRYRIDDQQLSRSTEDK